MKSWKKVLLTAACGTMAATTLTACGGGSGASEDTTFSMWIYSGVDSSYYTDYSENPVIQYTTQNKTWGDNDAKISLEFWTPAAGSEADNWQTMILLSKSVSNHSSKRSF